MEEEVVSILSDLVSIPTVNDPVRGIKPSIDAARYIHEYLARHSIESKIVESDGFYSVIGSVGSGDPQLMFLAHYDVVPVEGQSWNYDPFKLTIVDGKAFGRGSLDDKSNVAAFMVTLKELSKLNISKKILFAFTGDEEVSGENGAHLIVKDLLNTNSLPKYLVNGDGANHTVIYRRRKIFEVLMRVPKKLKVVKGSRYTKSFNSYYPVSQHAHAAYFVAGVDVHPLLSASVFVREMKAYVSRLCGNFVKSNVVPQFIDLEYVIPERSGDECIVDLGLTDLVRGLIAITKMPIAVKAFSEYGISINPNVYYFNDMHNLVFDVRAMSTKELVLDAFKAALKELPIDAEVYVQSDVGGYMNTSRSCLLIKAFEEVLNGLDLRYTVGEGAGASDSRYFVIHGVDAVDFGPVGGGMHGSDEYVDMSSLKMLPKVYLEVAKKVLF
ncbi:MAG: M20/M25/M40 family metallo-hydrolase [Sulfolobales archaeon]|nr:M20/M25/M40 family metallo-hydrolase [Sulfolobales archaeon]